MYSTYISAFPKHRTDGYKRAQPNLRAGSAPKQKWTLVLAALRSSVPGGTGLPVAPANACTPALPRLP